MFKIFIETLPGRGPLNFVLIHNAGADHRFFHHQIEMLQGFGSVTWLDLPGSGQSPPGSDYSMETLSALIVKVCHTLNLKNLCLIGLNNGANIAIEAIIHHHLKVVGLILIDPPIFMDTTFRKEVASYIASLEKAAFIPSYVQSFVDALFLETTSQNKEIAQSAFNQVDKAALRAIFQGLLDWDARAKGILKGIDCPTLCILTDEHHCTYEKMRQEAPQFELGKVIGSKCWATLEVPEQVNAMISRFLTRI